MKIPKNFLTDIYLGDEGPLAGQYAHACLCHRPYEEGEDCVLVQTYHGEFLLMHKTCVPSSAFEDDNA